MHRRAVARARPRTGRGRRGRPGSTIHVLSYAEGTPLVVAVTGANVHNSVMLRPMVEAIPAIRSRRGRPDRLHADKGYDSPIYRHWLCCRHVLFPASPAAVSRTPPDSGDTAGRPNAPSPEPPATAAWPSATNATAISSRHFAATLICCKKLPTRDDLLLSHDQHCPAAEPMCVVVRSSSGLRRCLAPAVSAGAGGRHSRCVVGAYRRLRCGSWAVSAFSPQ